MENLTLKPQTNYILKESEPFLIVFNPKTQENLTQKPNVDKATGTTNRDEKQTPNVIFCGNERHCTIMSDVSWTKNLLLFHHQKEVLRDSGTHARDGGCAADLCSSLCCSPLKGLGFLLRDGC